MREKTFGDILGDFRPEGTGYVRDRATPVSIWLPDEYKERFDALQKASRRQFGKKMRAMMIAFIEAAEESREDARAAG